MSEELLISLPGEDWNNVPETRPAVPAGIYNSTIEKYEKAPKKEKPSEIQLKFTIDLGIKDGPFKGSKTWYYVAFQPDLDKNGLKFLMNRAGVNVPPGGALNVAELVGRAVQVEMTTEMVKDPQTGISAERNKFPKILKAA